jgi:hypothetical protein
LQLKAAAAMQLAGGQPAPIQLLAVEDGVLHVLHGSAGHWLDEIGRIDHQLLLGEGQP